MILHPLRRSLVVLALSPLLLWPTVPQAADERERCDQPAVIDREACLREIAAVRAERSRGADVDVPDRETLLRNARARCEPLPEDQRADCLSRAEGRGAAQGSVEGGAILRETVKREIGSPAPVVPVEIR